MKLVSYLTEMDEDRVAIFHNDLLYDLNGLDKSLPDNMADFLWDGDEAMSKAKKLNAKIITGEIKESRAMKLHETELLAPVPFPSSCRDGYAFRQHVAAARLNRGVDMIKEFDQYPIFYFTNHQAILGGGDIECMPDHFKNLDFELEAAVVIGKQGKNIRAAEADEYIAGYMIMNDMSAKKCY
jgi:fumarylacetoacetate (FAA) hydrolase